jgi:pimeloyl-ACP methyl ester carboxylesterase
MTFMGQIVPRFTTTDSAISAAHAALIDRVGEVVVMVHSQAGQFGCRAAQNRPGKVKALVLLEPAGVGDPGTIEALRGLPVLVVYSDFIDQDAR